MSPRPHHVQTHADTPWHSGEIALQQRFGVAERMARVGRRVIRDFMPDQHRDFYNAMPFMLIGTVDPAGDVWASMATGHPGFMHSPTPTQLSVDFMPDASDPAASGIGNGNAIGMLGIELSTRRRNRMNGIVHGAANGRFGVQVDQSFGNCPQYIQLRDYEFARNPKSAFDIHAEELAQWDDEARTLITQADTFFVASYVDAAAPDGTIQRQIDVSHRGGKAGFVRIDDDGLTIPDFAGNLHFNTLGNLAANPRAGLIFADFATGDVLQITGRTRIVHSGPQVAHFQGAERLWTLTPTRIIRRRQALPIRWKLRDEDAISPNSLMTGSWEDTETKIEAAKQTGTWQTLRITKIVEETPEIRSFHLAPITGKAIASFKAGQHLPVRAKLANDSAPVRRVYTLSTAPSDGFYRISVKKQGAFSSWLHSRRVGDTLEARGPTGAFHIDGTEDRAAVLIAAGVGVTPMLSMLRQIVFEGKRLRGTRPTWFIHIAKSHETRAFRDEINDLVKEAAGAVRFIAVYSNPELNEQEGRDYSYSGRFHPSHLSHFLPFGDYDFYMCGPTGFMQDTYDGLRDMGVSDTRIQAEGFGPSSLMRRSDTGCGPCDDDTEIAASTDNVPVLFTASAKQTQWTPESGTVLDHAEAVGLTPEYSCRNGSCGTCAVKLHKGSVAYPDSVSFKPAKGEILLCSAVPAQGSETLEVEA